MIPPSGTHSPNKGNPTLHHLALSLRMYPSPPICQHTPSSLPSPYSPLSTLQLFSGQTPPSIPHLYQAATGPKKPKKTPSKPLHIPPSRNQPHPPSHCSRTIDPAPLGVTNTQSITHAPIRRCVGQTVRWPPTFFEADAGVAAQPSARAGSPLGPTNRDGAGGCVCRLLPPGSEEGAELAGPMACLGGSRSVLGFVVMGGDDVGRLELHSCMVVG